LQFVSFTFIHHWGRSDCNHKMLILTCWGALVYKQQISNGKSGDFFLWLLKQKQDKYKKMKQVIKRYLDGVRSSLFHDG